MIGFTAQGRRGDRERSGLALLALVSACSGACNDHGIVGVTAARNVGPDATAPPPRPAEHIDAAVRPDASGEGAPTLFDDCLPTNAASLDPQHTQLLIDGTGDASSMRFLYPYEGTVYPQGIPGPVLMWDGPTPDVVYVRMRSSRFDYRVCLKPSGPNRVELPSGMWDRAAASTGGAADPFTLELKVLTGETVSGPIVEQLVIAGGALKGSVYYMTYPPLISVGNVMRVQGGRPAETFLSSACTGCHSAAASGTRFLAYSSGFGASFNLAASSPPTPLLTQTPGAEFAGIYPDGSVYVASAHPTSGGGPQSRGGSVTNAGLYDTLTGTLIDDSGIPTGACMPSFSPDGQQLAFTDFGASAGHTLSLMRFSIATRTASAYRALYTATDKFVGWPAFLPGQSALVFTQGTGANFSGGDVGIVPVLVGPPTDLFIVDTATGAPMLLAQAMGFRSADDVDAARTFLPGGAADLHQNYYPTVSPASTGGYAWVLFDSFRTYGNQGAHRAIWGAAISLSPDGYRADPSHPAFYLPGQGLNTPNFRAVAALDP